MVNFEIHFSIDGSEHTGVVHKIPPVENFPVQYLVFDIEPEIKNAPSFFVYNPQQQMFDFGGYNESIELPGKMMKAIKEYCTDHHIPLTQ